MHFLFRVRVTSGARYAHRERKRLGDEQRSVGMPRVRFLRACGAALQREWHGTGACVFVLHGRRESEGGLDAAAEEEEEEGGSDDPYDSDFVRALVVLGRVA